jgi:soluble lytic murein transglycosylase
MAKFCAFCAIMLVLFPLPLSTPEGLAHKARYDRVVKDIETYVQKENTRLSDLQTAAIARLVYRESCRYGIDYRLILAVMKVESNFRQDAVSCKGALGLLQVKPSVGKSVARRIGMDWTGKAQLKEPQKNIRIGVHHLSGLMKDFAHLPAALDAYNKGAKGTKVKPSCKLAPDARYASAVMGHYAKNLSLLPDPQAPSSVEFLTSLPDAY